MNKEQFFGENILRNVDNIFLFHIIFLLSKASKYNAYHYLIRHFNFLAMFAILNLYIYIYKEKKKNILKRY